MNVRTLVLFSMVILSLVLGGCVVPLRPVAAVPPAAAPSDPSAPQAAMPDAAAESAAAKAVVVGETVKLLGGPGANYPALEKLSFDDTLLVIGQLNACTWLQAVSPDGHEGWVYGRPQNVTLDHPCADIPLGVVHPSTGEIYREKYFFGIGKFLIENGTDADALVTLIPVGGQPVVSAYIRKGDSFQIERIRGGDYQLFFSHGEQWDTDALNFTGDGVTYKRFEDPFHFIDANSDYSTWEVTLNPVAGGTASTVDVPPDEFPVVSQ